VAPVLLLAAAVSFRGFTRADTATDDQARRVGQNFVVGIPNPALDETTRAGLAAIRPAGIILYYRNYQSAGQFKGLIADLQQIAVQTTGRPYLILLDEEPGGATRLGLFQHAFALGTPDWDAIETDAALLAGMGVNVDLAPVADYPFDPHSFIARRVPPVTNVDDLIRFNRGFIEALREQGVAATLKHFPGMGIFEQDPHRVLPKSRFEDRTLRESLRIFRAGVSAGAEFVMTAHGYYQDLDPDHPVATSSRIVTELLRRRLGFDGIIMTDDLSDMRHSLETDFDLAAVAIESLKAGHNLVMFSHKLEEISKVIGRVLRASRSDPQLLRVMTANCEKLVRFKSARLTSPVPLTSSARPTPAVTNQERR
jgi:beta-N-acetylhexosaminidase